MDSIADNLGKQGLLVEHIGGQTRFAMIHGAHRVEGMCRRAGSRDKTRFRIAYLCITVPHAATYAQRSGVRDQLCCSWQLRRNGHQANFALCSIPEAVE